jgi:hypothetical protein
MCGKFVPAAEMALKWHQAAGQTFACDLMYRSFRRFCLSCGMTVGVDFAGTPRRKRWSWFRALTAPTLLVFDHHAVVLIGTSSAFLPQGRPVCGYHLLDPACSEPEWIKFPDCGSLALDFAFSAP